MTPAIWNIVIGLAQPLIPAFVTTALSQGWITADSLGGFAAIAAAVAAGLHSAATTTAVTK